MKLRLLLLTAAALLFAPSAGAATWKQVTASGGANIDQVALLRTPDGVLHVAWHHRSGPNTDDLLHTTITPNGTIGATTPIASGWAEIQNPALVLAPGGIRVFFGGIRTTTPGEPNQELNTALSTDGGANWALQNGSIVPLGAQAYGSPVSATILPDGTLLEAWAGTLGTWVHAGLDPATPNHDYQAPLGNYGYDVGIAASAAGRAVMAWYSNATGKEGVFAQDVARDGSPVGSAVNMPGTGNMLVGMIGRTPIVARVAPDFYVVFATGYPSLNRIRLWRVGASSTRLIAKANQTGNATATLATDLISGNGRLWVAWTDNVRGTPRVFARRSRPDATVFGATVSAGRPNGASAIYRLDGSATATALDVFANSSTGITSTTSTFMRRIFPGLTLTATPRRLHRGRSSDVTFKVTDAGIPVAGARVRAGGESGLTKANGKVTLNVAGRNRSVAATATAPKYVGAHLRLRVVA